MGVRRQRSVKRQAVGAFAGDFQSIFDEIKTDMVEELLRSFGLYGRKANTLTGRAAPGVQADVAYRLRRLDSTIQKRIPEIRKMIEQSGEKLYLKAVNEARHAVELGPIPRVDRLGDSELYQPTIDIQRRVLETELTAAIRKSQRGLARVINGYALDNNQRARVQEAVAGGMIEGKGVKGIADRVLTALNRTGGFSPELTNAVQGKLITVNGRNFDLAYYSELVAESRMSELYVTAQLNEYTEDGYELVQVDDHDTTSLVCAPFEGTIWSITGRQVGQYLPIEMSLNGGPPYHPRCSHYTDPVSTWSTRAGGTRISNPVFPVKKFRPNDATKAAGNRISSRIGRLQTHTAEIRYDMAARAQTRSQTLTAAEAAKGYH